MTASRRTWRWWVLGPLLAGAAWLAVFGDKTPTGDAGKLARPTQRAPGPTTPSASASVSSAGLSQELLELRPREELITAAGSQTGDLFRAHNWTPPPPPPGPVVVPPPAAPPLPYTYAGKKQEQGYWEVYLLRGDTALLVREGSNVENAYAVVAIRPPVMTLKYLPLGQQQTLAIGEAE